jgi:putative transposase
MNRGAGRSGVLESDADKQLFLDCLVQGAERYAVEVHAYCLMSTHYHLMLRSAQSQLSGAMRHASGMFTRLKNKRDKRDGPLFRGRFTSVPINTDAHQPSRGRARG